MLQDLYLNQDIYFLVSLIMKRNKKQYFSHSDNHYGVIVGGSFNTSRLLYSLTFKMNSFLEFYGYENRIC